MSSLDSALNSLSAATVRDFLTVIEAINKVGSAFYGPILAAFLIGVLSRRIGAAAILLGILAGVGLNVGLWLGVPALHWMWWNLVGCVATTAVAALASLALAGQTAPAGTTIRISEIPERETRWRWGYLALLLYPVVLMLVLALV